MPLTLLLMQAVTPPPSPPTRIDMTPVLPCAECRRSPSDGEIVVCGEPSGERYRLRPVDPGAYAETGKAETASSANCARRPRWNRPRSRRGSSASG